MSYYQKVVMKTIKRLVFLHFLLIAFIPSVFAEIIITLPDKQTYNLGEKIMPTVSIKEDQGYNGFFKLNLVCDSYNLQYYTTPLSLEAGIRTQVPVPELTFFSEMKGTCSIKASFDQNNGDNIDNVASGSFVVTDLINIISNENIESNPGEHVLILADIKKASNEVLSKGEASIKYKDEQINTDVTIGKLEYKLYVTSSTEAGDYSIIFDVTDKFGNKGEKTLSLKVPQIPTNIENDVENNVLMPGDSLKAKITLYDHTHKVINQSGINIKVFGPNGKLIAEKDMPSLGSFEFITAKSQGPGTYYILSTFEDVKQQSAFTINEVKKISMKQDSSLVHVENIGNVDYTDETTIILEKDGKKFLINKELELKPQETLTIDLSEEVPQGSYDVILPENAVQAIEKQIVNESNETPKISLGPLNIIKDVPIEDHRPIAKKTADGIFAVTGAVVSTAKVVASRPALASIILVTIILGVVAYYSRGFIVQKIKGKKDDSKIFKDYEYSEEKK